MRKKRSLFAKAYHAVIPDFLKPYIFFRAKLVRNYGQRLLRGSEHPLEIFLETSTACNRTCEYCGRDQSIKETLDDRVIKHVIDQVADWGFRGLFAPNAINEPLADGRIFDILAYACARLDKAYVDLFTNGDLLTKEVVETLRSIGVRRINISLHDPLSMDQLMGLREIDGLFDNVFLYDMRKGHRTVPLTNRAGCVDIGETVQLPGCYQIDSMQIRANGDVVLCCNDYPHRHVMGNAKGKPLREIWHDKAFSEIRSQVRMGVYLLEICQRCGFEAKWAYQR